MMIIQVEGWHGESPLQERLSLTLGRNLAKNHLLEHRSVTRKEEQMPLQVINQALRGGEGLGHVSMRAILLRMLPPLLRIQVCLSSPSLPAQGVRVN